VKLFGVDQRKAMCEIEEVGHFFPLYFFSYFNNLI